MANASRDSTQNVSLVARRVEDVVNKREEFSRKIAEAEKRIGERSDELKKAVDLDTIKLLDELESFRKDMVKIDHVVQEADSLVAEQRRRDEESSDAVLTRIRRVLDELSDADDLLSDDILFTVSGWPPESRDNLLGQIDRTHIAVSDSRQTVERSPVADTRHQSTPTSTHTIPGDGRPVVGLTYVNFELFVFRLPPNEEIDVYETKTMNKQRTVRVLGLSDDVAPPYYGLASCSINNCLYVSDNEQNVVHRVDLSEKDDGSCGSCWSVGVGAHPTGISVNGARNVLVTCYLCNGIREYTTRGSLVREIKLQPTDVSWPLNAVELTTGEIAVCHEGPESGVSIIDVDDGRVRSSYGLGSKTHRSLVAVNRSSSFLIADAEDNAIVLLNSSLQREDCPISSLDIVEPWCLHLDEDRGRLYIGELGAVDGVGKRVLVFDSVTFE